MLHKSSRKNDKHNNKIKENTMIKFEEHEGQLFRMLDKPVPLTPDAEMPCIVRLIQDDSPMGKYNQDAAYFDVIGKLFVAQKIKENPFYSNTLHAYEKNSINQDYCIASIHTLEIIGTFVEEGSAEWALYQMMHGNKVINSNGIVPFTLTNDRIVRIDDSVSWDVGHWLRIFDDTTGWQLYKEPKPEPIFTTGDKVTDGVIDGTIIHIEDAIADVCPSTDEYKIELRNLNHISESPKQDDVEKPLRSMIAEAKAIGKNIRTYYQDIVFTPQALEACLNQGEFRWWNICNWELTKREANMPMPEPEPPREPEYIICKRCGGSKSIANPAVSNTSYTTCPKCGGTGYEIREPKPESENIIHGHIPADMHIKYIDLGRYKVGDWVEITARENIYQDKITFSGVEFGKPHVLARKTKTLKFEPHTGKCFDEKLCVQITRKLSPSEVILDFGSGIKGWIRRASNHTIEVYSKANCWLANIRYDMLDTETRKLVESLLKAQEEEKC
jgi:hypothetical protein